MKVTPVWKSHGTTRDVKKPGTYWTILETGEEIFTPAPFNCRRIAKERYIKSKQLL